jgi:hypothetical protein
MRRDGANILAGDQPASLDKKHRSAKLGHALRLREVKARALQLECRERCVASGL